MISGGVTRTTPPPAPAEPPAIAIAISRKGELFLSGAVVTDANLPQALRDIAARDKEARLLIQADQDVAYARVVFVLDQAKAAGLRRISFGTEPAKSGEPPKGPAEAPKTPAVSPKATPAPAPKAAPAPAPKPASAPAPKAAPAT